MTAAMTTMTNRVAERLTAGLKKFQPILTTSKARDDGEADTVMIVTDMLADLFGYDKYAEVTAEYAIRGTYCDLATKLDGTPRPSHQGVSVIKCQIMAMIDAN
jgi:hypothetical protein